MNSIESKVKKADYRIDRIDFETLAIVAESKEFWENRKKIKTTKKVIKFTLVKTFSMLFEIKWESMDRNHSIE